MKKFLFLATAIATASLFTGCSNNEYVGDQPEAFNGTDGAIAFSMGKANTTRVDPIGGEAAAEKLNKQFWVYGWKTVEGSVPNPQLVFKNYKVTYLKDSRSSSNTNGWEYVGITIPGASPTQTQTIKYWDYSADHYDFEAYSYNSSTNSSPERGVTKQTAGNDYGLEAGDYEVKIENNIEDLYFAQKKTVSKSITTGEDKYGASVKLTFKSVLSKIRVGFYETIPGYSVKIEKFYKPNSAATDFDKGNPVPGNFVAWCPNKAANHEHPFVVNYDSNGTPAVTKVWNGNDKYISFDGTDGNTYTLNPELTLGSNLQKDKVIGDSYSKVTWDRLVVNTTNPDYTYFIPQNDEGLWSGEDCKVQPMRIKVDYTLTSTDGSKEEIHVKGATAIVPAEYLRWKPNTAYSYVFKISDNTNGTTGTPGTPGDPVGLYPITFDAVVEDMAEYKDHLTTVSDLSITATQGKQFDEADKAVFKTGEAINVKVMMYDNTGAASDITNQFNSDQTDYQFMAAFVTTYAYNKSQEDNLNGQTLEFKNPTDGNITLEGKSAGYWIVKVTYKAGNETIIKYAVLKVGTETTPPSQEGGQG